MGDKCHFAHGDAELRTMNDVSYNQTDSAANSSTPHGAGTEASAILEALLTETKRGHGWPSWSSYAKTIRRRALVSLTLTRNELEPWTPSELDGSRLCPEIQSS